jgi:hypothetical protein
MIGIIAKYMKDQGESLKTIRYYMNDDDFVADTLSDLRAASNESTVRDDITPELEDIKRLSGIGQGMGF